MPFFHVDQRPARQRCLDALARIPAPGEPGHDERYAAARVELLQSLEAARMVFGASRSGIRGLLLNRHVRGDHAGCRRIIERAIPSRGAMRRGRVAAATVLTAATGTGLWIIAPALALAAAALALVIAVAWCVRRVTPVYRMIKMLQAARAAAEQGLGATLYAIHQDVHRMIAEDRVPPGTGVWLIAVMRAAVDADPFPVDLLRDLRRLLFLAPEVDVFHTDAERTIERQLQLRTGRLVSSFHRSRREGGDGAAARAELRALARTAPSVIHARGGYAEVLATLGADALDEIAELLDWIAAVDDPGAQGCDGAPRTLIGALERVVAESSDPAYTERARALLARAAALPSSPPSSLRPDLEPAMSPATATPATARPRRSGQPVAELHDAVAAPATSEETRRRVLALYRQVRDTAVRRPLERHLTDLVTAMRLAATWAHKVNDIPILAEIYDGARALIGSGRIPAGTGAELAGVLRECAGMRPFPMKLLDDFGALRALAHEVVSSHYWSIVDMTIGDFEVRLDEISRGGAGSREALRKIALALEQTAARSSDPALIERARSLGARAAALSSLSP